MRFYIVLEKHPEGNHNPNQLLYLFYQWLFSTSFLKNYYFGKVSTLLGEQ